MPNRKPDARSTPAKWNKSRAAGSNRKVGDGSNKPPLKKKIEEKPKKPFVSEKYFTDIIAKSCSGSPANYQFNVDWSAFTDYGIAYWNLMHKKGGDITDITPGAMAVYFKTCFLSYLEKNAAWTDSFSNQGAGTCALPKGMAIIFRQCSSYKNHEGFMQSVSCSDANGVVFVNTKNWPSNIRLLLSTKEPTVTSDTTTISTLSNSLILLISEAISSTWKSKVLVNDIPWGASSGELFLGANGSSLTSSYTWSNMVSVLLPYGAVFDNSRMQQATFLETFYVLAEMMSESHHEQDTVCGVLRKNNYDPMYFRANTVQMETTYCVQMLCKIWAYCTSDDGFVGVDLYSFIVLWWSYVSSFLPIASIYSNPQTVPNFMLREWKMPWVMTYMVQNMWGKRGNMFLVPIVSVSHNWTQVYQGADTSNYTGWGCPGFLSSSVPGVVNVAGVVQSPSTVIPASVVTSWQTVTKVYTTLTSSHNALFLISAPVDGDLIDCGCSAEFELSTLDDDYVGGLGVLQPRVIASLNCPAPIPMAVCEIAMALTWRTTDTDLGVNVGRTHTHRPRYNDSAIDKLVSMTTTRAGASQAIMSIGRGSTTRSVHKQLSGGYDYVNVGEKELIKLISAWGSTVPFVKDAHAAAAEVIAKNLPDYISIDTVHSMLGGLGRGAVQMVGYALAQKKIGFPRNR